WNLIPRRCKTVMGPRDSDGLALLRTPFLSKSEVRKRCAQYYMMEGWNSATAKRVEESSRWYEEGLKLYPESILLRNDFAVLHFSLGRFDRARQEFLAILSLSEIDPKVKPLVMNNVAAADLLLDRPELLEEADR